MKSRALAANIAAAACITMLSAVSPATAIPINGTISINGTDRVDYGLGTVTFIPGPRWRRTWFT